MIPPEDNPELPLVLAYRKLKAAFRDDWGPSTRIDPSTDVEQHEQPARQLTANTQVQNEAPEPFVITGYKKLRQAFRDDWGPSTHIEQSVHTETEDIIQPSSSEAVVTTPHKGIAPQPSNASNKPVLDLASKPTSFKLTTKTVGWMIALVLVGFYYAHGPLSDLMVVASPNAPQEIIDIANNSGFNTHGKAIFYRAHPELVDANTLNSKCPNNSQDAVEFGCYLDTENKIYLLSVSDANYKDIEYTTAAHETLHAAWQELDEQTRQAVSDNLMSLYQKSTASDIIALKSTLQSYSSDNATVINELHSFMGSQIKDASINAYLISYYNKYFSNRAVPVDHYATFNDRFTTETNKLDTESHQLDDSYAALEAYKAKWLDTIEADMQQDEYYGDIVTYNENVDAYNHNLVNYNNMVSTYNTQKDSYNAEVQQFNTLLASFRPSQAPIQIKQQ